MRKPKLYLETSVWNFLFADDAPAKKDATEQFFVEIENGKYEIYISTVVETEIRSAPHSKKLLLNGLIDKFNPVVLEANDEVADLAHQYISSKVLAEKHIEDLMHLSIAVAHGLTALISWNLRHLVNMKTFTLANSVNRANGYHEIMIFTPEEVLEYED